MKASNKLWIALGLGVAVGGVLGVLFAPEKGSVTREKWRGKGENLGEDLKEKFKKGRDRVNAMAEERFSEEEYA